MTDGRARWQGAYDASPRRAEQHTTMSGVPVDGVYGAPDGEFPGEWPYTRGPYASMYRSKLWTMRQFAGFGTAEDTNERFHRLLSAGGGGLSTAFDMPTLMGRDSDHPLALGEVGRAGVAVDSLADMETLFAGIDLGSVSTSMTINSAAAFVLALYVAVAERAGVARSSLRGTLQNDILKEYQAQKEYVFPPRPSTRLVTDVIAFCTAELPRWHPVSISGYHIREAGSTAAQELAFTLANGFAYVEAACARGLAVDAFAPRLSFFFNAHIDFFEEIAKYRAARRIWARWMRDRYGARDERSLQLRFHTQTAGVSLTAQQPEVNIARVAIEALAGVLGGTQSLHTDAFDEALALPTERSARIALRTQQVIAHETGVANVADPLGGSYFVEALTDELEGQAEAVFAHLEKLGKGSMLEGVIEGIDRGWFQGEIADAAFDFQRRLDSGEFVLVGVNDFTDGDDGAPPTLYIDPAVEERQLARLAEVRAGRDGAAVDAALARIRAEAADPTVNLMPALVDAAHAFATVGEVTAALEVVFGTYTERQIA
jgi:methylmalonyl-CoA mutase N-terminal domain/subunit